MAVPRPRRQVYSDGFSFDHDFKKMRLDEVVVEVAKGLTLKEAAQVVFERHLSAGVSRPTVSTMMGWGFGFPPYVKLMADRKKSKGR